MEQKGGDLPPPVERVDVIVDTQLSQQVGGEEGSSQAARVREAVGTPSEAAPVLSELPPDESLSKMIPRTFTSICARDLDQIDHLMAEYDGMVKLVTNVASFCKTTDTNYDELMQLYDKFLTQGFQFKQQEYQDPDEIKSFIANYNVSFPVFDLTIVNGPKTHPVFLYCKWHSEQLYDRGHLQDIEWNFGKFLLDRNNRVYKYYKHDVKPLELIDDIRKLLNGEAKGKERGLDGKFVDSLPNPVSHK
ncbi:UNVERIFIED_CONTAM: hypothetical protein H355_015398 [Colinus virginianus]|nr:hypothetical protein H355_015398 [Colinus virginianus]